MTTQQQNNQEAGQEKVQQKNQNGQHGAQAEVMQAGAVQKSTRAMAEESVLSFWKEQDIFTKTTQKDAPKGEFVFFEGPPTANAKPALHHLAARAFKDVVPRYKTMQGFRVRRKAGWDTHGLPVELQIEKKLGLQSKKDIEQYGVAAFNKECKDSVFTYIKEWETFTDRIGYWVDKNAAYYTFDASYMESLWNILGVVNDKKLLYKDYKVLPWCCRCGTALSSHELAQGYQDVKDLSVYALFHAKQNGSTITDDQTYIIAWTTTPWTLPGNVALAVGKDIIYVKVSVEQSVQNGDTENSAENNVVGKKQYIVAKERLPLFIESIELMHKGSAITHTIVAEMTGAELVGVQYQPLYPYVQDILTQQGGEQQARLAQVYTVYTADFVTTTDGTGVVHIAPMYGADDFVFGTIYSLPKFHTVNEQGLFIDGTDFLAGRFAKDETVAVDIIKDLAHRGLLFKKEKYEHSYPHCWRCKTPLLYYARDSWYIGMSQLREQLVAENATINWEPSHIKEGRFGEWLKNINDWAISRERYWGTPLPIWTHNDTKTGNADDRIVVNSIDTIKQYTKTSGNTYVVMRHGQTHNNLAQIWNCDAQATDPLTDDGCNQVAQSAEALKEQYGNFDVIVVSPYPRTKETARIVSEALGMAEEQVITNERLVEWNVGPHYDKKSFMEFFAVRNASDDRYHFAAEGGESYAQVFTRASETLYDLEKTYQGKKILIITHGAVTRSLELACQGARFDTMFEKTRDYRNFDNAEFREVTFVPLPHNEHYELDLHRPYIDSVVLHKDGKDYYRVKEVMDVWFDSGAMPFAQDHYPFENKDYINTVGFPADFICEAIDQTRGWFYTLHAIGALMGKGKAYKNVICLGHLLDAEGKKMSKSIGNIVEPFSQLDSFGADAVRFWMYSVNQPGESKNYDPKTVAELSNKVFGIYSNVLSFYELYRDKEKEVVWGQSAHSAQSAKDNSVVGHAVLHGTNDMAHVLDQWIIEKTEALVATVTDNLDQYNIFHATRAIKDFLDDLSTWYLRRSRDRIKDDSAGARATLYYVLKTTALLFAPFAPFTAESAWQTLRTQDDVESVHLASWPVSAQEHDMSESYHKMDQVRTICTMGNALRKKIAIPVRQPLAAIMVGIEIAEAYQEIIKDELNVKAVVFDNTLTPDTVRFDEVITDALRAEGAYRELIRTIQDMRKAQGLSPSDTIALTLPEAMRPNVTPFLADLAKTVQAQDITFTDSAEPVVQVVL